MSIEPYDPNYKGGDNLSPPLAKVSVTKIDDNWIRYIEVDGEYLFALKDVYAKIGAKDPKNSAIVFKRRYCEKFKEYFREVIIQTPGGPQKVTACTEELVYIICMRANTDRAFEFQKRVSKLLKLLRRGDYQLVPNSSKSIIAIDTITIEEHSKKLEAINREVLFLKRWMQELKWALIDRDKELDVLKAKVKRLENQLITVAEADELKARVWELAELAAKINGLPSADTETKKRAWKFLKLKLMERGLIPNVFKKHRYFTKEQYAEALLILQDAKAKLELELKKRSALRLQIKDVVQKKED